MKKAMEKLVKKKALNLKAQLKCKDIILDGSISIMDGLFKSAEKQYFFLSGGTIDFEYGGKSHSFPLTNLGGKYFIKDYRTNPEYQRVANMITLNETLEVKEEKKPSPKVKV
jgi:hypothetical protein